MSVIDRHRSRLHRMMRDHAEVDVGRLPRLLLDSLDQRALDLMRDMDREDRSSGFRFSTEGLWGPNGRGPSVDDVLRLSRKHLEREAPALLAKAVREIVERVPARKAA